MNRRVVVFLLVCFALVVGLPLLIGILTSKLDMVFLWMLAVGGVVFVALGVLGQERINRWLGVPARTPQTPYLRRRAAISAQGLRAYLILFGLSSVVIYGLPENIMPEDIRYPVGLGMIVLGVLIWVGFVIASRKLVPPEPPPDLSVDVEALRSREEE